MAIEEVEEENTGASKDTKVTDVKVEPSIAEQFRLMQEEIAKLKENQVVPAENSDNNELIKTLVQELRGNQQVKTGQFEFDSMHTEADIDPDDALEEKDYVTFITHKVIHVIVDDKRNGRNIRVPFEKIVFKYVSTKQVKNGRETDVFQLSTYTCTSKKELAWLRAHSLFGITFFDKMTGVLSKDAGRAFKLARQMMVLKNIGQGQIINMAKQRGISIGDDLDMMRSEIANIVVEEQILKEQGYAENILRETKMEAELTGQNLQ